MTAGTKYGCLRYGASPGRQRTPLRRHASPLPGGGIVPSDSMPRVAKPRGTGLHPRAKKTADVNASKGTMDKESDKASAGRAQHQHHLYRGRSRESSCGPSPQAHSSIINVNTWHTFQHTFKVFVIIVIIKHKFIWHPLFFILFNKIFCLGAIRY